MKALAGIAVCLLTSALVAVAGDCTAKISDVHLCCKGCVDRAEKAVAKVSGVKAQVDQDAGTVTLSGASVDEVQKAADALVAAGYFGKAADDAVKLSPEAGAKGEKVSSATVEGVHLCCGKCVKAVDKAVNSVNGAKAHTATKGAKSFEVTGDFNDKELMAALQKQGLTGKVAK